MILQRSFEVKVPSRFNVIKKLIRVPFPGDFTKVFDKLLSLYITSLYGNGLVKTDVFRYNGSTRVRLLFCQIEC